MYYPHLYATEGKKKSRFTMAKLLTSIFRGSFMGIMLFFFIVYCLETPISKNGYIVDIWSTSIILYSTILYMVSFRLYLYTRVYNIFVIVSYIAFPFVFYFIFLMLTDTSPRFASYRTAYNSIFCYKFFLIVIVCVAVMAIIDVVNIILRKEIWTPLAAYFNSILRKGRENEYKIYESVIEHLKRKNKIKWILKEKASREDNRLQEDKKNKKKELDAEDGEAVDDSVKKQKNLNQKETN